MLLVVLLLVLVVGGDGGGGGGAIGDVASVHLATILTATRLHSFFLILLVVKNAK